MQQAHDSFHPNTNDFAHKPKANIPCSASEHHHTPNPLLKTQNPSDNILTPSTQAQPLPRTHAAHTPLNNTAIPLDDMTLYLGSGHLYGISHGQHTPLRAGDILEIKGMHITLQTYDELTTHAPAADTSTHTLVNSPTTHTDEAIPSMTAMPRGTDTMMHPSVATQIETARSPTHSLSEQWNHMGLTGMMTHGTPTSTTEPTHSPHAIPDRRHDPLHFLAQEQATPSYQSPRHAITPHYDTADRAFDADHYNQRLLPRQPDPYMPHEGSTYPSELPLGYSAVDAPHPAAYRVARRTNETTFFRSMMARIKDTLNKKWNDIDDTIY